MSLSPDQAQALNPGFGAMAVRPLAMVTPPATADLTALVDAITYNKKSAKAADDTLRLAIRSMARA